MSRERVGILSGGCVLPIGVGWSNVRSALESGVRPEPSCVQGLAGLPDLPALLVPGGYEFRSPRLRRSSAISHFACGAAHEAAGACPVASVPTALVFAASDGAVVYTRRFYEEVVASGAGSPLLFPETVYNAPASHVAALLGLDGIVLSLVGDATAGIDALSTACDLITSGAVERCIVVASQEADWISCEGYRLWGMAAGSSPEGAGTILSEGACAIVLGVPSPGDPVLERVHPGLRLSRNLCAEEGLRRVAHGLCGEQPADLVMGSGRNPAARATGQGESTRTLQPARSMTGEAFAVTTLLECLRAACEVRDGRCRRALVLSEGWGAISGAVIASAPED